jgi:hypothetical protein
MSKHEAHYSMTVRVLGYKEGAEWAAHCLETDLIGYGKTFDSALRDLIELTEMQVSFALHMKQPNILDHPAPPEIFETYSRLAREQLATLTPPPARPKDRALGAFELPMAKGRMAWSGAPA